jgi:hypothetical protein
MTAAPYLHPKLNAIDANPSLAAAEPSPRSIRVEFVVPSGRHTRDDEE